MGAQESHFRPKTDTQEGDAFSMEDSYSDNESTLCPSPETNSENLLALRNTEYDLSSIDLPGLLSQFFAMASAFFWLAIDILIPSFIPRFGLFRDEDRASEKESRRDSPTEFMDGLRGIATVIVYAHHFVVNWFPALRNAYGGSPTDVYTLQLPILRVFLNGGAAVATFFVISGYALSYSGLKKLTLNRRSEAFDGLSSSVFRRCLRIYLPCVANTLICAILSYNGLFVADPPRFNPLPPQLPTLSLQIEDWWYHLKALIYPFRNVEDAIYSPPYNGHLWTIPLEIRGSWVTYGTVLASANLAPAWRMFFLGGWSLYVLSYGKWDLFLFTSGVFIANLDVQRHLAAQREATSPSNQVFLLDDDPGMIEMQILGQRSRWSPWSTDNNIGMHSTMNAVLLVFKSLRRILSTLWPYFLFIIAMYTLSDLQNPWGVDNLLLSWFPESSNYMAPGGRNHEAWIYVGAVLLVYSVSISAKPRPTSAFESPPTLFPRLQSFCRNLRLQWLFTNRLSRYLGKISFGVYLMHGPVLFTMGTRFLITAWIEWDATHSTDMYVGRFFWAVIWNTIGVIWAGDVFTRLIDEPSVRLTARMAKFMSRSVKR